MRVGSWIDIADGMDVNLSPGSIDTFVDNGRASKPANGLELKRAIIREHLERELPLPASAADRELLLAPCDQGYLQQRTNFRRSLGVRHRQIQ